MDSQAPVRAQNARPPLVPERSPDGRAPAAHRTLTAELGEGLGPEHGPSTTSDAYLLPSLSGVATLSILTVGIPSTGIGW